MAELAQCLRLDLANALAGDAELAAHLFEGAAAPIFEAEAELEDAALAARQAGEHVFHLLAKELLAGRFRGSESGWVFEEVAEVAVLLFADWRLKRDRLLRDLLDVVYLCVPLMILLIVLSL